MPFDIAEVTLELTRQVLPNGTAPWDIQLNVVVVGTAIVIFFS